MLRSNNSNNRGSVSLLFIVVVLPLLLLFSCLGIELTQFFGVHDDIQQVVDNDTRASLTKRLSASDTQGMIRTHLNRLSNFVEIEQVTTTKTVLQSQTRVEARYRGIFGELFERLSGKKFTVLPVRVSARVRKVDSATLIVLDRTVLDAAEGCNDAKLKALQTFVDALTQSLLAAGSKQVSVAVVPGDAYAVQVLDPAWSGDFLKHCRDRNADLPFDTASLSGSAASYLSEEVAHGVVEAARATLFSITAEARAVVFIQQGGNPASYAHARTIFTVLDEKLRGMLAKVIGIHLLIDSDGMEQTPDVSVVPGQEAYGVALRSITTTTQEIAGPLLMAAVVGRIGEKTVLVF